MSPASKRILIIKQGALGDVVRTTSLLPALKKAFPSARITWVTVPASVPLLSENPLVDRLLSMDELARSRDAREEYDWVLSLDDDAEACRLASSLRARKLSGAYADAEGNRRYTEDLSEWFGMGLLRPAEQGGLAEANRLKKINSRTFGRILLDGLGLEGAVPRPQATFLPSHRKSAERFVRALKLLGNGPLIGINTGAGPRWQLKSWGIRQTAELALRLRLELDARVLLLGGAAESERNREILGEVQRMSGAASGASQGALAGVAVVAQELDLRVFAALVAGCEALVSSDSLAMHLGVAAGIPVVAFFGPTSDSEIDLFGRGEKVVTALACSRCYLASCSVRPHCMQSIRVDEMLTALKSSIREARADAGREAAAAAPKRRRAA